jgi:hypothetical protein
MWKKYFSILFIFLMGFLLFPWQLMAFCPSHYEVHEEHHGNCADGIMENDGGGTTENEGPILGMPDECYTFSIATEDFQQNQILTKVNNQQLALTIAFFQLLSIEVQEQPFPKLPDQKNNSSPPFEINTFRGPPVV